jgi:hypothetical protein
MKLHIISEESQVSIVHYDSDDYDYQTPLLSNDIAQKLAVIAFESISISRSKDLVLYATKNGEPVGGVWAEIYSDDSDVEDNEDLWVYDFDVVVSNEARDSLIGPRLINAAIRDYEDNKYSVPGRLYIKAQVINPKLAAFLEKHHGFKPVSGEWHPRTPYMTYGL